MGRVFPVTQDDYPVHPVALPLPASTFADGSSLLSSGEPVTVRVAPGSYPVVLSLVQPPGWPALLVAAAMLQFSEAPPGTWP